MANDNIDRWFQRTANEDNARHASAVNGMCKSKQPNYIPISVVGTEFETRAVLSLYRSRGSTLRYALDIGSSVTVSEESDYSGVTYYTGTTYTRPNAYDVFVMPKSEFDKLLNNGSLVKVK